MQRHRFDPLSFALGLVAIGVAVAVIAGRVLDTDRSANGAWLAIGALVVGLGLIPWNRRAATPHGADRTDLGAADQAEVSAEPTSGSV